MAVGPGEAARGGGFLTGWKGIALALGIGAVAVGLGATGYSASQNSSTILAPASTSELGSFNDFGFTLYGGVFGEAEKCITNGTIQAGSWSHVFKDIPDESGDNITTDLVSLELIDQLVLLGDVWAGDATTDLADDAYLNRPEVACFAVCREQFADDCRLFAFDGVQNQTCRFLSPEEDVPDIDPLTEEEVVDGAFYVFDGACMQQVRERIAKEIELPATGLKRNDSMPNTGPVAAPAQYVEYSEAIEASLQFLQTQWAGAPSTLFNDTLEGNEWKYPGFVNKAAGCPADLGGSFATGDHVQATLATAQEAGVLSLASLWWTDGLPARTLGALALNEIAQQARYLINTYDAASEEVLVGVGDQLTASGTLLMYQDFGSAPFALQDLIHNHCDRLRRILLNSSAKVAESEVVNGLLEAVPPACTYSSADAPAADVAAQAAASLALSSQAFAEAGVAAAAANGTIGAAGMLSTAEDLYAYSKGKAGLNVMQPEANATDTEQVLGASQLYPSNDDFHVRSHQLWAACTLWQATGLEKYWNETETIYKTFIRPEIDPVTKKLPVGIRTQLFDPVANFYNPVWWGLMCIAQSSPEYSGIVEDPTLVLPRQLANVTAEDRDDILDALADQDFGRATRAEAREQIWQQFVLPWITYDGTLTNEDDRRVTEAGVDGFRYFDINGEGTSNDDDIIPGSPPGVPGIFRDSAGAAAVALLWADLPGVEPKHAQWARCMAKDTIDFMLGQNSEEFSYVVGVGESFPANPFHKDAACPPEEIREQFEFLFEGKTVETAAANKSDALITRPCDFLTFTGDPQEAEQARPGVYAEGDLINRVLDNANELTGALVSSFLPTDGSYLDARMTCPDGSAYPRGCESTEVVANPMSGVSVDANGALTAALAGLANLPAQFFEEECPNAATLAEDALAEWKAEKKQPRATLEDEAI